MNTVIASQSYEFTSIAPKTKKEVFLQLDFYFSAYLRGIKSEVSRNFLKELIKSKGGIKSFLEDIWASKVDFDDENEMTLKQLYEFLSSISEVGQEMYNRVSFEEKIKLASEKGSSKIELGGKDYFQNPEVKTQDMVTLEVFFRHFLVEKFMMLTQEATQQKEKQFRSYELTQYIKNSLLEGVYFAQFVAKIPNSESLLQLLLILIENSQNTTQEQQSNFIELCKNIDMSSLDETGVTFLINGMKNIFPEIYSIEHTKYKVHAILLGEYSPDNTSAGIIQLLPEENFYFRKHEEIVSDNDVFPEQGNMLHLAQDRLHGLKDICIFDTFGNKVFWGDIGESDIRNIHGTYYILSQSEGWREVPEFAKGNVISLAPVEDPFIEQVTKFNPSIKKHLPDNVVYLLPEYIRAFALGKIENGQYTKNFKNTNI